MDVNPYESPREMGYSLPRQRSRWWDFAACVATGLLIHAVVQAAGQAYRILKLDWTTPLQPWRGHLLAIGLFALVAFYGSCVALGWWRKHKRTFREDVRS